jgi:hypothetical protein
MALMDDANRLMAAYNFTREPVNEMDPFAITSADIKAAADAIDQWISDNSTSFNSALPLPFRTAATAKQKVRLFVYVLRQRYNIGTT